MKTGGKQARIYGSMEGCKKGNTRKLENKQYKTEESKQARKDRSNEGSIEGSKQLREYESKQAWVV